jgi:hypothetical protein
MAVLPTTSHGMVSKRARLKRCLVAQTKATSLRSQNILCFGHRFTSGQSPSKEVIRRDLRSQSETTPISRSAIIKDGPAVGPSVPQFSPMVRTFPNEQHGSRPNSRITTRKLSQPPGLVCKIVRKLHKFAFENASNLWSIALWAMPSQTTYIPIRTKVQQIVTLWQGSSQP